MTCDFYLFFRVQANRQDLPGLSVPITRHLEEDEPESSQRVSTPLVEESAFPEVYNNLIS